MIFHTILKQYMLPKNALKCGLVAVFPNFKSYTIYAADMSLYGVEESILVLVWIFLILQFGGNNECINPLVLNLLAFYQTCSPEIYVDQYKNDRIYLQQLHSMVIKTNK